MFRVLVLAAMVAMTCGCVAGSSSCAHADETTYRCRPLIAGERGCVGGPRAASTTIYPVGCQVDVPECSELDPGLPRTFECVIGARGEPDWYEPI